VAVEDVGMDEEEDAEADSEEEGVGFSLWVLRIR
jgi:hypothetical protein